MPKDRSRPRDADGPGPGDPVLPIAVVARQADGPDRCTMFPDDVTDSERQSRWLTATEGSFVALPDVR